VRNGSGVAQPQLMVPRHPGPGCTSTHLQTSSATFNRLCVQDHTPEVLCSAASTDALGPPCS
jgi:hypothetical protein